jgi:hypothetical protein
MTSPAPASDSDTIICPACHSHASGKFCSNCGAALAATKCVSCGAELHPGAKFCHRCGTAAGAEASGTEQRSFSSALPWAVAAIALVAFIALIAGQRFGRTQEASAAPQQGDPSAAPFAGAAGSAQPPDISQMTPAERAIRLYNRVMAAHENGHADTVAMFAPMAIQAYMALDSLDLDARYDLGRIAAISGDQGLARAEADTILARHPNHLLGLILAGNAARMRKDTVAERQFHDALVAAAPTERKQNLPEYTTHENDITIALDARRP